MQSGAFSFGSIQIDGVTYQHDVVIDHAKCASGGKSLQEVPRRLCGHTPISLEEKIPWKCRRLVIGTGMGALPVMKEVKGPAERRGIKWVVVPTAEAIELLKKDPADTNAILHVTC